MTFAGIAIAESPVLGLEAGGAPGCALEVCQTPLSWRLCSQGGPRPTGVGAVPHGARVHSSPVSVQSGLVPRGLPSRCRHITVQRGRSGCRDPRAQSLRGPDGRGGGATGVGTKLAGLPDVGSPRPRMGAGRPGWSPRPRIPRPRMGAGRPGWSPPTSDPP